MTHSRNSRIRLAVLALGVAVAGLGAAIVSAAGQTSPGRVEWIEMSFKLPAVGNVSLVKEWQFGRITTASLQGNDYFLVIRGKGDRDVRVSCPRQWFTNLATSSNWYHGSQQSLSSKDYVERMIAFAYDGNRRVIAIASLEPIPRDGKQLAKAYR